MKNDGEITFHSTTAFVKSIAEAKKFYTEVLGQVISHDFGQNVIFASGITLWEIRPGHIIHRDPGQASLGENRCNRFEFYFETEDIERTYERLKENGVEFLHGLHEEPWGQRTVRFFDPDRHLIEVGETLKTFVGRLAGQGRTAEQIMAKTSIPLETVRQLLGEI